MNTKEKARQDAATSERAKRREKHRAGGNSHDNFTTGQGKVSRFLLEGRENGLHLSDLVRLTGWTEREVRQQIHLERRQHIPIASLIASRMPSASAWASSISCWSWRSSRTFASSSLILIFQSPFQVEDRPSQGGGTVHVHLLLCSIQEPVQVAQPLFI